jgi:hypothetical protein
MNTLHLALLPALLIAACAAPQPQSGADRTRSQVNAACRAEAERVVRYRDRGQVMRQDDYNARVGTQDYLGPQVMSDQLAQIHDRDQIAAACVRGASGPESARGAPGNTPRR